MALDIGIQAIKSSNDPLERKMVVSLEEADTAFLYDVFQEIKNKTGIDIVPWDDARLQGEQLTLLGQLLGERIEIVKVKPCQWEEHVGFQNNPKRKIYVQLVKSELLKKLYGIRALIEEAKENQRILFFFGD